MDEIDLANYPGLYARSGVWYVRKRVPVDLIHVEARGQIRLSLETTDKKTAVERYPLKLAEIQVGFVKLRAELKAQGKVTAALRMGRLEALGRVEIEGLVAEWWAKREHFRKPEIDELADIDEVVASIDDDIGEWAEPSGQDGDPISRFADQLLVKAGIAAYPRPVGKIRTAVLYPAVNRSTDQYRYLCELVGRALPLESLIAKDHVLRRRNAPYDPVFNPLGTVRPGQVFESGDTRSVRDLISEYRAERYAQYGRESTDRKYGLLFRVMEEVLGRDRIVRSIDRAQCIGILAFLRKLPPNATKRFPNLTLSEAAAKAEREGLRGLAPNTVGSYMQNLIAILRWAKDGGWGLDVHAGDLIDTRKPRVRRRRFEVDELEKLFSALEQFREGDPTKFWVPAVALYTGARAGEICQLRVEDVQSVNGVLCLNLSEFDDKGVRVEDKRLKTEASERYVPLHPALIEAGFAVFVDRENRKGRLFPDLNPGPKGNYSHEFSKWFGRFKKRVGFHEPSLVFHSFRHGFRDACRDADISDEAAMALGGWAAIHQAQRYGLRGAVPNLDRAMRKLEFGGFRLNPSPDKRSQGSLPPARKRTRNNT